MILLELDLGICRGATPSAFVLAAMLADWWRRRRGAVASERPGRPLDTLLDHYNTLFGQADDVMLVLDAHRRIVAANDRASEWYGYNREELLGQDIRLLRGELTLDAFTRTWEVVEQVGRAQFETIHRRRDGSEFVVEVSVRTIEIEGRRYHHGVIRDITQRRQAEGHVARLHRLHSLLSHCGQVLARPGDEDTLCRRTCEVAAQYGRFSLASIAIADAVSGTLVPVARAGPASAYLDRISMRLDDEPLGQGPAGSCLREGASVICQDIAHDPRMAPWQEAAAAFGLRSSIALPLRREGRVIGVLSFYADEAHFFDAEEAQLAEELAASLSFALDSLADRERIERVLDAMDEGYWDWNLSTGERHVSPRLETLLGYDRGELAAVLANWIDLVHPVDRPLVSARLQDIAASSRERIQGEFRVRRKSGETLWVLGRARAVVREGEFGVVHLVGTLTDITERKALEDQFLQSQKLETVGRLAGGVAHDFNNVLTVINGHSELLLGGMVPDGPPRQYLEAIRQAGERASGVTRQLLTFSRKHDSAPAVVSLGGAVREFERLARGVLREGVTLTTRVASGEDHVFVDPAHLHQVLMNLVVNARDAMPDGGSLLVETADVEVAASSRQPEIVPGRYLCLTVADSGQGMDADTLSRIFEPFFTTKEKGRGTGLGLSTVYGIVRQSGGFLKVHSEPGVGTSFHVYLPKATRQPSDEIARPAPLPVARGTETILVAEDQRDVREVTVTVLRSWGYTVLSAASGDDAVGVAARHEGPIDLLLTDVIMPGIDGLALSRLLTQARPQLRTIFTSGYPDEVLGRDRILAADVHYLPKPFAPDRLLAFVRDVLGPVTPRPIVLVVDDDPDVRRLFADALGDRYAVLLARDGVEGVEVLRSVGRVDLVIIDLFMPRQDGTQTIQAIRGLAPTVPIVAISGAFGGQFLGAVERVGVDATLTKPVPLDVLRATAERLCPTRPVATSP